MKLLLVDDDRDHVQALAWGLESNERTIITETDPRKVEDIVAQHFELHAVISNLHMPHLSGSQVLARVRAMRPELFRILMSGKFLEEGSDEEMSASELCQPHLIVPKPVDRPKLIADLGVLSSGY